MGVMQLSFATQTLACITHIYRRAILRTHSGEFSRKEANPAFFLAQARSYSMYRSREHLRPERN